MKPKEIIEQCTENGLTLSITDDGNLDVVGSQDWIDIWSPILRENKSSILAALTCNAASNVSVTLPVTHHANALQAHSGKYSITCTDASIDPVLVGITIAGQTSFTMEIPKQFYNGIALLELLEKHNETHSVMPGLSKETEGIDSRRAA